MITDTTILKIRQIVRYFETSKVVGADYGAVAIFNDGPGSRKQLTYGASQTTEYGRLRTLLNMYVQAAGQYAVQLAPYVPGVGDLHLSTLADNPEFLKLLRLASTDLVMHQVQDKFFNQYYFEPAHRWFYQHQLTLPLSLLVIYDSYVHSGSIRMQLRRKFPERLPVDGGDEKIWITQYVQARDAWLENYPKSILQRTDYRTDSFIHAIHQNNWYLADPFEVGNYVTKTETGIFKQYAAIA